MYRYGKQSSMQMYVWHSYSMVSCLDLVWQFALQTWSNLTHARSTSVETLKLFLSAIAITNDGQHEHECDVIFFVAIL